jgi:hypothetical protein
MPVAEQALHDAMDELAQAERRLSELPRKRRPARRPAWFVAAVRKGQAAGDALEQVYQQIAQARAQTKAGLGIKLRLLVALYGETSDGTADEPDTGRYDTGVIPSVARDLFSVGQYVL